MASLKAIDSKVSDLIWRARLILFWERVWPSLFCLIMAGLFYCALSWLGIWHHLHVFFRLFGLAAFGFYGLYYLIKCIRTPFPAKEEAISYLEAGSSLQHRPLSTYLDEPALVEGEDSPLQKSLWKAHQKRLLTSVLLLKNKWPKAQVQLLDRYGIRAFIILITVIGFQFAGSERLIRLFDAFSFSTQKTVLPVRLDAWVTPPKYTGKAPIFLTRNIEEGLKGEAERRFVLPQNSHVTVRLVNSKNANVVFKTHDGREFLIISKQLSEQPSGQENEFTSQLDYSHVLKETGTLSVSHERGEKKWAFDIVRDLNPEISFVQDPEIQRSGAMEVLARIKDDYGVHKAEAHFFSKKAEETKKETKPLYEAPSFDLRLRRGKMKDGVSKTLHSLAEHPWAGSPVLMQLKAYDEAGQEGKSELLDFTLPSRQFVKPLAKALVEQRRLLALDAYYVDNLVDVIDVLTLWPEQFEKDLAAFISLASIRRGLLSARSDDDLRKIVDDLWQLALAIEEGEVSDAEQALQAALEALREGIRNGATSEELAQLMDDVRQALDQYIQALANEAQNDELANNQNQQDQNSQTLDAQDLQNMLDRIQELAETGSRDAAENLLSELQQMMENLQAQQQNGEGQESTERQMLNELGDMIRQQQRLMDQTFRERQRENQEQNQAENQQNGEQNQNGQQGGGQSDERGDERGGQGHSADSEGLSEGQGQLADQLRRFLNRLAPDGGSQAFSPNGEQGTGGQGQLDDAQRSMRGAAGALQQGDLDGAGNLQSDALNQLRAGAQRLSEQLAGNQSGQGTQGQGRQAGGRDPLGRQNGRPGSDFGDDVDVPDEIDTQRAREILDVIRKRLGERLRPQEELDYLERLLVD